MIRDTGSRTIAMTVFGDLDDTRIGSMPSGRTPVATYLADSANAVGGAHVGAGCGRSPRGRRVVCRASTPPIADAEEEGVRPLASVEEVAAYLRSPPASPASPSTG